MNIENLSGKEVRQKYYVVAVHGNPQPVLALSDWSKDGTSNFCYTCYGQVEITYTVPNADPLAKAVEAVDSKIESLRAEFQHNLDLLQEKKQQLLAIGCDIPAAE
jgi:hypothetical protein